MRDEMKSRRWIKEKFFLLLLDANLTTTFLTANERKERDRKDSQTDITDFFFLATTQGPGARNGKRETEMEGMREREEKVKVPWEERGKKREDGKEENYSLIASRGKKGNRGTENSWKRRRESKSWYIQKKRRKKREEEEWEREISRKVENIAGEVMITWLVMGKRGKKWERKKNERLGKKKKWESGWDEKEKKSKKAQTRRLSFWT